MRRIRIIGLCLLGAMALAAFTTSSASAALPELGQCKNVGTGGAYKYKGCVVPAPGNKGAFEWVPGPGAKPKFEGSGIFEAVLETVGGTKVNCGPSEFFGEWTGPKTASVNLVFKGCLLIGTSKPCSTQPNNPSEIKTEMPLEGELGYISGAGGEKPKVGLDLKPKSPSTSLLTFNCQSLPGEPVGEPWTITGSAIGEEKVLNKMKEVFIWLFRQVNGKQIPEKFETGVKDTLLAERIVGAEKITEQVGLTLKEERKTFITEGEEPLEIKAK
jgi:hypothetical protein